jgi:hypothetical protein
MTNRSKEDLEFQGNILLVLICLGLLFGLGRCVYSIGYPYTCDDAHSLLREHRARLQKEIVSGTRSSVELYLMKVETAKKATQEKCPPGRMEF